MKVFSVSFNEALGEVGGDQVMRPRRHGEGLMIVATDMIAALQRGVELKLFTADQLVDIRQYNGEVYS